MKSKPFQDRNISVIIQGPITSYTALTIQSVKQHLPLAEIILSTWENENVEQFNVDQILFNQDPGGFEYTNLATKPLY